LFFPFNSFPLFSVALLPLQPHFLLLFPAKIRRAEKNRAKNNAKICFVKIKLYKFASKLHIYAL